MSFAAKVTCTSEARAALDDSRERIGGRRAPQPNSDCSGPHSGRGAWAPAATAPRRGMIRAYLAKVRVEGSNPFSRSTPSWGPFRIRMEPAPDESQKPPLLVEVIPATGVPWCGAFRRVFDDCLEALLGCPDQDSVCVVAGGVAYAVPVNAPTDWSDLRVLASRWCGNRTGRLDSLITCLPRGC
jgi:hypothetical protein